MSYEFKVKNKQFLYKPVKYNYNIIKNRNIKYIVVHDTGNASVGANALKHYNFFNGGNRKASAHIFIDNKNVVQIIGDSKVAWHVGDGKGKFGITNANSLGIEICINSDENYEESYYTAIEVVKACMERFNVPLNNVVRHYDASRKNCPQTMNNRGDWSKWWQFKELLKEPKRLNINLDHDSAITEIKSSSSKEKEVKDMVKLRVEGKEIEVNGKNIENKNYVSVRELFEKLGYKVSWENDTVIVDCPTKSEEINKSTENTPKTEEKKTKFFNQRGVFFIETTPDNIEIKLANGSSLLNNGINGGFFNVSYPNTQDSCWGIAIQDNKPLNINSYVSNYECKKRGTIIFDDNNLFLKRIYNIKDEYNGNIKWGISGFELYPNYGLNKEGILPDVARKTNHTALGFKGNKIYLMACRNQTLQEFKNNMLNSTIAFDGIIGLDGGASTQMFYEKPIIKSTRRLNHYVSLRRL